MRRAGLIVIALVLGAGLAAGGYAVRGGSLSAAEPTTPSYVTAAVTKQTLRQTLVTRGTLEYGQRSGYSLSGGGRITQVSIAPGDTIGQADELFRIDNQPVYAMAGDTPLWRDLVRDDKGPDVAQVIQFLRDVGYRVQDGDTYTARVEAVVKKWQKRRNLNEDGSFRSAYAIVLDLPSRIAEVSISVGDFVGQGTKAFDTSAQLQSVSLTLEVSDRQQVQVGQPAELQFSSTGQERQGTVAEVSSTPQATAAQASGGGGGDSGASTATQDSSPGKYPVRIAVDGDPGEGLEGSDVRVTIILHEAPDALAVPAVAIVDNDGAPAVRLLHQEQIQVVPVTLGIASGALVQVTEGVAEGQTVVLGDKG
ncbi:MAG: efflux RND transporter periplasmic adaptor subunit [Actinomycetales bacterium]